MLILSSAEADINSNWCFLETDFRSKTVTNEYCRVGREMLVLKTSAAIQIISETLKRYGETGTIPVGRPNGFQTAETVKKNTGTAGTVPLKVDLVPLLFPRLVYH